MEEKKINTTTEKKTVKSTAKKTSTEKITKKVVATKKATPTKKVEEVVKEEIKEANENVTSNEQVKEQNEALEVEVKEISNVKQMSPTKLVLRRFFRSKLSVIGLIIVIGLFVFSFLGPYILQVLDKIDFLNIIHVWGEIEPDASGSTTLNENLIKYTVNGKEFQCYDVYEYVRENNLYAGISADHWLGTDANGYDIFTRLMYGGRISLMIGFIVVFMELLIGIILGGIAGYFGKWVDQIIMRIVDIFNCIPTLPILLIAASILDSWEISASQRIYYLMFIITFFGWSGTARMVRGQILYLREQEYMVASEVMGYPTHKKIFGQLIPNVLPQLIVSATLGLGSVILYESTLSYLGLGVQIPYAAWGTMISTANNYVVMQNYPLLWVPAGICIVLAVLGFNFVGDGLRDAFDPKGKR